MKNAQVKTKQLRRILRASAKRKLGQFKPFSSGARRIALRPIEPGDALRMNIVYVSRKTGPDSENGVGAYINDACLACVRAGHKVLLITEGIALPTRNLIPKGVELVETEDSLPHQKSCFFTENQEYSYRVLNTLRRLTQRLPLDCIEFPDCRAEGFATTRAKRLLNEFAGSKLIVRCHMPLSLRFRNQEDRTVQASVYCDFEMEDYCVRHADLVTAPSAVLAKYFQERVGRNDIRVSPVLLDNYTRPLQRRQWLRPPPKKVSVIIPFYNQGQYLAEAIQSVRDSGYPELEIVVVNDGSSDAFSNEVFERTEGVVKVRKENGGLSSARNAGIRAATGDYLLMLDSDDKLHAQYIATAVQALENNPDLSYLASHAQCFGASGNPWIPVGIVPTLMRFMNTAGTCAIVIRREVFAVSGGYDEQMVAYEDWDFLLTVHDHGLEGDVLPAEFLYYRQHFDSMLWTVANPRRAELIQYMMRKHAAPSPQEYRAMAIALVHLWKREEIRAEQAEQRDAEMHQHYARTQAELSRATAGALPPGWLSRFFEKTLGQKLRTSIRKRITALRSCFEDSAGFEKRDQHRCN